MNKSTQVFPPILDLFSNSSFSLRLISSTYGASLFSSSAIFSMDKVFQGSDRSSNGILRMFFSGIANRPTKNGYGDLSEFLDFFWISSNRLRNSSRVRDLACLSLRANSASGLLAKGFFGSSAFINERYKWKITFHKNIPWIRPLTLFVQKVTRWNLQWWKHTK